MSTVYFILALASVAVGIVASIAVTAYVAKRGIKVNYFLYRIMVFKYFNDYKTLSFREEGKVGSWYYVFLAAMLLALVFVVVGLVTK